MRARGSGCASGEHPELAQLRLQLASSEPGTAARGGPGSAAVALILRGATGGDALELLFVQRAERAADPWSGHMAFPGGRWEPCDIDLRQTALRESLEEVGFEPTPWLGSLGEFRPMLGGILVGAHAFGVREPARIALSDELQASVWIPLAALREPDARAPHEVSHAGSSFSATALRHGPYVIWGLTLRITDALLAALFPAPTAP